MTDYPGDIPDLHQPYLHDLVLTVNAPAIAAAGSDGALPGRGATGVFVDDRRILSRSEIALAGAVLVPTATEVAGATMTRSVLVARGLGDGAVSPTVWVEHRRILLGGRMAESFEQSGDTPPLSVATVVREAVEIRSAARQPVDSALSVTLGCDFADIAEVKSGRVVDPAAAAADLGRLRWIRIDDTGTTIVVEAVADPDTAEADAEHGRLTWPVHLEPGGVARFHIDVTVRDTCQAVVLGTFGASVLSDLRVASGDVRLPRFIDRSLADLRGLELRDAAAPEDHFLAAGAPWYLTLFGRDSLISARMLLPLGTRLAAGTLRTLARRQGAKQDPETAEQPGKILHELRRGPSDLTGFGGHGRALTLPSVYYGTVDATPLWITLLRDAWRWGMPPGEVEELLDPLCAALAWMRDFGLDEAGFLSYHDTSGHGLANQGWKDSYDSVQFADGRLAPAPLALAEVQGYAYQAAMAGAELLDAFDRPGGAQYRVWGEELADRFRARFWVADADGRYPAVALDRDGQPVDSVASNMGHLLDTGLLTCPESTIVAARLAAPTLSSGYGLRTLATSAAGYNPLSYHLGSVWTHDTAIAVQGLARAASKNVPGAAQAAQALIDGLLEAAFAFGYRIPELYAGFAARPGGAPTPYPASCRPQAWAAAASVVLVTAVLGIEPDSPRGMLRFKPMQESRWAGLTVRGLCVGNDVLDVRLDDRGTVEVLESKLQTGKSLSAR